MFAVLSDSHSEFCDFGDVTALVLGAISIVDGNRYSHLLGTGNPRFWNVS